MSLAGGRRSSAKALSPSDMRSKTVILNALPPGFIDDLPHEDQQALLEAISKPVAFQGYDEDGRAELEFKDREGTFHTIYVDPKFIRER